MSQKWNIQDIRPVEPRKKRTTPPVVHANPRPQVKLEADIPSISLKDNRKQKKRGYVYIIAVFLIVIAGAFGASALMSGAEVSVYPHHRSPNINAKLVAYPDVRSEELTYELMPLEEVAERQVKASGQETVTTQTTGLIEIIKTTPGAERLIKNTRFRSPDGLVFRIQESVVVPGAVTDSEGNSVPGTIQAEVFADEAGDEYNLAAGTRFDVPGFQENGFTELYNAIYAENRSALTGGYDGPRFMIDEKELETARQALHVELRDRLLEMMEEQKPAGYVIFEDAVSVTFNSLPAVEYGDDLVTIKEQAVLQLPLFPKENFASYIAGATIPGYEGDAVRIDNYDELTFSYSSATTSNTNLANLTSLEFNLTGEPLIVYTFDETRLKADILGAPKTALTQILGKYPAIDRAEAVVRPFWQRSFPGELNDITITEVLEVDD